MWRRQIVLAGSLMLTLATETRRATAQTPAMSSAARAYLTSALDTLESAVIRRDTVSWRTVRDSAFVLAAGAQTTRDTYAAIAWALQRGNKHGFLQAARPGAVHSVVAKDVGYVRVPSWSGGSSVLADSLQSAIAMLSEAKVCGWIVDVRGNGGGNMWPMLAGIGPLFGDTIVGSFGTSADASKWFYKNGLSGILHANGKLDTISRATTAVARIRSDAPVAVLFDGGTGSSGEAVVLAFRGRPGSRSFGEPTAGFSTSNRGVRLTDGANLVLTTGYQADRRGVGDGDRIPPDSTVHGGPPGWPFATDVVASTAAAWLQGTQSCHR